MRTIVKLRPDSRLFRAEPYLADAILFTESRLRPEGIYPPISGYVAWELDLSPSGYILAGSDQNASFTRILSGGIGSYEIISPDAKLIGAFVLKTETTIYPIVGFDTTFVKGFTSNLVSGSYTVSGPDLVLSIGRFLSVNTEQYSIDGIDITTITDRILNAQNGIYLVLGKIAYLIRPVDFPADSATYDLTGSDLGKLFERLLIARRGVYELWGHGASVPLYGEDGKVVGLLYSEKDIAKHLKLYGG